MKYLLGSTLIAFALICTPAWAQRVSIIGNASGATGFGPVATSPSANGAVLANRRPIGPGRPGGCTRGNCLGHHRDRFLPNYYWPGYYGGYSPYSYGGLDPFWELDESTEQQPSPEQQPSVIVVRDPEQKAVVLAASPKVIEVPPEKTAQGKPAAPSGPVPPAVFILTDGQRLEAQRYLLTHDMLQVQQGRERRTIPLHELNVEATVAANHARGIDLQIPENKNQLTLGF